MTQRHHFSSCTTIPHRTLLVLLSHMSSSKSKRGGGGGGHFSSSLLAFLAGCAVCRIFQGSAGTQPVRPTEWTSTTSKNNALQPCDPHVLYRGPVGLPTLQNRGELGKLCEVRGLTDGLETGVKYGRNAARTLTASPSCQSFTMDVAQYRVGKVNFGRKYPHLMDCKVASFLVV